MAKEPQVPMFRIDVSAESTSDDGAGERDMSREMLLLLQRLAVGQERQNELLEELSQQLSSAQRQRANELGQWRQSNPDLARNCRLAAEALSRVQTEFLRNLTDEIAHNEDCLVDGEFMFNEFVDRFGPRLAHLNGVLQVLSQLSSVPPAANQNQQ